MLEFSLKHRNPDGITFFYTKHVCTVLVFWLIIGCFVHPKFLHLSGAQPDQIEHHSGDLTSPAKSTRYADFVV
jgi:hypothetical protein